MNLFFILFMFISSTAYAQHEGMHMNGMYGPYVMTREASGTSWQPDSSPMEGRHWVTDEWMLMSHGFANGIYTKQQGSRGDEEIFTTSMFMFMGQRELDQGVVGLRTMLSLDPAMGKRGYPLLLQTGETADGLTPLIDRQHPHDLFMEMAATYSYLLSDDSSVFGYVGLPGEPALGPPAFMHRFSGINFPDAPITHHWLDSTHITYGVVTLGYVWQNVKLEGSVFRGREPDEDRWDLESPNLDSYAGRISLNPNQDISIQFSLGRLDSSEQLEPSINTDRVTASIIYNKLFDFGNWQTTFGWGRNNNDPGNTLDGYLIESAFNLNDRHTLFSRWERVEKDELFEEDDALAGRVFDVNRFSLGYIYDFPVWNHMQWGIGGSYNLHFLPDDLQGTYGKNPEAYFIFARLKFKSF
jgi:hypothetical protein